MERDCNTLREEPKLFRCGSSNQMPRNVGEDNLTTLPKEFQIIPAHLGVKMKLGKLITPQFYEGLVNEFVKYECGW